MSGSSADPADSGAVLMALWDAQPHEVTVDELLRRTRLPMERLQRGLTELSEPAGAVGGGGRIERTPGGIRLVTVGLNRWHGVLQVLAARHQWRLGRSSLVIATTASTNDIAWERAEGADGDGLVVIADEQTAGRGRFGHRWHAGAGQSVLMSAVLHQDSAERLDSLTLLVGLAVAEALERAVEWAGGGSGPRLQVAIKWPNDLMVKGRKIGGILVEQRKVVSEFGKGRALHAAVVGVGINVTQSGGDFPAELGGRAISLFEAAGSIVDRLRVCAFLLDNLNRYLAGKHGEEREWLTEWKTRCALWGQRVEARSGGRHFSGLVVDIEPLHGLVLRDDSGATHFLSAQTTTILS